MAYSIPIVAFLAITFRGNLAFATPVYAFVVLPILELILPIDDENLDDSERERKEAHPVFNWLLYLNLPLVYGLLIYALIIVVNFSLKGWWAFHKQVLVRFCPSALGPPLKACV